MVPAAQSSRITDAERHPTTAPILPNSRESPGLRLQGFLPDSRLDDYAAMIFPSISAGGLFF
jgi:hypothetical protein